MEQCLKEITEITPNLYLSSVAAISDANLHDKKINLIINATKELPIFPTADGGKQIHSVRIPVYDMVDETLYPYFKPVCDLIEANHENNGSTLIHCVAGRSRSATLTIAYLLWKSYQKEAPKGSKYKLYETLDSVQKKRTIVQPNMAFMGQLVQWEDELKGQQSKKPKQISDRTQEALNEVASITQRIKSNVF